MNALLEAVLREFLAVVAPFRVGVESPAEMEALLARYGWDIEVAGAQLTPLGAAFALEPLIAQLAARTDQLVSGNDQQRLRALVDVLQSVKDTAARFSSLQGAAVSGAPFDQRAFWDELAGAMITDLLVLYLERRQPLLFAATHALGVIRFERQAPAGAHRMPWTRTVLDFARLGRALGDPGGVLRENFGWGTPGFDHRRLISTFERIALVLGHQADVGPPRQGLATGQLDLAHAAAQGVWQLDWMMVDGEHLTDRARWRAGLSLLPVPRSPSTGAPAGVVVAPILAGGAAVDIPLGEDVTLRIAGAFGATDAVKLRLLPDGVTATAGPGVDLAAKISLTGAPAEPYLLFGAREKTRLELDGFTVEGGFAGNVANPEAFFRANTGAGGGKLKLHVAFDEADGFIKQVLGEGFDADFGVDLLWSSRSGLSIAGSGGIEFQIPINLDLTIFELETIYVSARGGTNGARLSLGAGFSLNLGPLSASVEDIGITLSLVPAADGRGAFGPLDLAVGFKPPKGVGLSLDAGVVRGGGYLYIDAERGEYAGALELTFAEFLSLKAIGILTTRMPDGSDGFSLLVIITAEFGSTGLQLGYGFTLLGVGGLVGLNRTMRLDALVAGVRNGAVNNIMFPRDIVANAPRIISDLRAIFPPEEGTFLIGPMAKLGWGTPTLVSISLGVIIEIPGNIAILGVLRVALPAEVAPVVVLQVSFVGAIEFDRQRLWFFASLFDSRILFITLDGDMGLLAAFGEDANFVLSIGGFHPRFTPPPLPFPVPTRLSVTILNESWARIRAEGYFAVTSNTAQFGARAEIFLGFEVLSVESVTSFDALLQFSPLHFDVEIQSHFSVKVFGLGVWGLSIRLCLEGPTPWRARGEASIALLFFDIGVSIDVTWGEPRGAALPDVAVLPLLAAEIEKQENWRAFNPAERTGLVTLRGLPPNEVALVLHPAGTLRLVQKLVPLDVPIAKLGNRKASDGRRFSVSALPGGLEKSADVKESFAAAQFNDLSDADRLAAPGFEPMTGGLELTPAGSTAFSAAAIKRANRYELATIDTQGAPAARRLRGLETVFSRRFLAGAAVSRSGLSAHTQRAKVPFVDKVEAVGERFVVASALDNAAMPGGEFGSEAEARAHMAGMLRADPSLAGRVQVLPAFEVVA
jgi:hypothetical protein